MATGPLEPEDRARLEALLAECAALGTGATLALHRRGEILTLVSGETRLGGDVVQPGTQFNVASVSKAVTAARIVSLAHAGRIALDDSVRHRLPGVALVDASGTDLANEITLRDLLRHRAGLPRLDPTLDPGRVGSSWTDPALLTLLTDDWRITLASAPGDYAYSNLGYALLGAVIERVEGVTFSDAMARYLVDLGMTESTFWPADVMPDAAHGRVGSSETFREPAWYGSRYAIPISGLWTSARDVARFGETLIAASRDEGAALREMIGPADGYGLGLAHSEIDGAAALHHDGGGPGFVALFAAIPERGAVLALACNADGESPDTAERRHAVMAEIVDVTLAAD